MKKKLFLTLLSFILIFSLTACGDKTEEEDNTNEETENTSTVGDLDDVELYSDDAKYVFELANTKYVFYYSGNTITGYETYVGYDTKEAASIAYAALRTQDLESVDKYYLKGKYIVFKWKESEYADLSVEDIKLSHSYMKELKKNSQ